MLVRSFSALFFLCSLTVSFPQSIRQRGLSRQLSLSTDNDFLLLTDRYYTFGMDLEFNSLLRPESRFYKWIARQSDSAKVRMNYHYGNKIFTPNDIETWQTKYMDRPYAGWNFVQVGMTVYNKHNVGHDFGIEVGLIGEISGMGQFQRWWHELINIYPVNGWDSQIANEVVVNLHYNYTRDWKITRWIDLVSISKIVVGTGANRLGQDVDFRFFKFNPINNSAFTNSRLSWSKKTKPYSYQQEAFLFAGIGGDYVASNIFIEGSLFKNNPSVYTLQAEQFVFTARAGFTYSRQILTYSFGWYHLSKEIKDTRRANYLSLSMSARF
ncbi:MAG TPA: lipid A deacylase LpxR family protein [Cyclobacteriaceae bacterium]|nr:lipid A deacylase LpxR family protein [Cyclobacteriaceae bacterium]